MSTHYPHVMVNPPEDRLVPYCLHCNGYEGLGGFDIDGTCKAHQIDAEKGLAQRRAAQGGDPYRMAHGIAEINRLAKEGWRAVSAGWPGAGCIALMERS